jgi:hypothetical protein
MRNLVVLIGIMCISFIVNAQTYNLSGNIYERRDSNDWVFKSKMLPTKITFRTDHIIINDLNYPITDMHLSGEEDEMTFVYRLGTDDVKKPIYLYVNPPNIDIRLDDENGTVVIVNAVATFNEEGLY